MVKTKRKLEESAVLSQHGQPTTDDDKFHSEWETFFTVWGGDKEKGTAAGNSRRAKLAKISTQHLRNETEDTVDFSHSSENIPSSLKECEDLLIEYNDSSVDAEVSQSSTPEVNASNCEIAPSPVSKPIESRYERIEIVKKTEEENFIIVPESAPNQGENPYCKEFYETGAIVINKLRIKKQKPSESGWAIFIKKENTGRYGTQAFKPSIFKLSLWESKELRTLLQDLSDEIDRTRRESLVKEIPRLVHPNSRCTDMQLDAYWDEHFTARLSSNNLQFRPVRHLDGALTVKFFSKRNSSLFPSGGISMSLSADLLPYFIKGLFHVEEEIQTIERVKFGLRDKSLV